MKRALVRESYARGFFKLVLRLGLPAVLLVTGLLATACIDAAPEASNSALTSLAGEWTVAKVVDLAPVVGLTEEQVASLPGQTLLVTERMIGFQNRKCAAPAISISRKRLAQYFQEYRIPQPDEIDTEADVVEIKCARPPNIGPFLRPRADTLYFVWRGALLKLVRSAEG